MLKESIYSSKSNTINKSQTTKNKSASGNCRNNHFSNKKFVKEGYSNRNQSLESFKKNAVKNKHIYTNSKRCAHPLEKEKRVFERKEIFIQNIENRKQANSCLSKTMCKNKYQQTQTYKKLAEKLMKEISFNSTHSVSVKQKCKIK